MRIFPIDVEIELAVTASSFEEAKEVVLAGLKDGRYAKDAKICFNGSAVDKHGRLKAFEGDRVKQYAHGDELAKKRKRKRGEIRKGDLVKYTDPDGGVSSGYYSVAGVKGEVISLFKRDLKGNVIANVEAFRKEVRIAHKAG